MRVFLALTVQLLSTDSGHTMSVAPCSSSDWDLLLLVPFALTLRLPADSHGAAMLSSMSMLIGDGDFLGLGTSFSSLNFSFFIALLQAKRNIRAKLNTALLLVKQYLIVTK